MKLSFPSIKAYDGTTDPDDHVAQYKKRMLAVAFPKESRDATMCKGFGSTLTRPALQWYINLPSRSIASFAILSDKFVEQFASSRDLEKTSDSFRNPGLWCDCHQDHGHKTEDCTALKSRSTSCLRKNTSGSSFLGRERAI